MDTELDENQMDYAQTANKSGKDLISVINDVLDQAKIEAGKLELEAVAFDPHAILEEVLSLFSGKSKEKGIEEMCMKNKEVQANCMHLYSKIWQIIGESWSSMTAKSEGIGNAYKE
ncbi:Histidine kinase 2 [Stylosanthes scabra]|uniref:histidine kinase n=1 Tax=Stylosanthes scabra TaxID=79078 RepID=A0ABU6UMR9_9FABA|nr:Histidine kinase 2 [Stylosanthes scabra]